MGCSPSKNGVSKPKSGFEAVVPKSSSPESASGLPSNAMHICDLEDFPECTSKLVKSAGREYAVWRQKGQDFYALDNACYHRGSPILPKAQKLKEYGNRLCVACPWHGYNIAVEDGEGLYYGVKKDMKTEVLKSKGRKQRAHRVLVRDHSVYIVPSTEGKFDSDQYYGAAGEGFGNSARRSVGGLVSGLTPNGVDGLDIPAAPDALGLSASGAEGKTVGGKLRSRGAANVSGSTVVLTFTLDGPLRPAPIPGVHADFVINPKRGAAAHGGLARSWTILSYSVTTVSVAVRRKQGGAVSPWIMSAPLGTPALIRAALEADFVLPPVGGGEPPPLLLAAGGVGITPLLAMIRACFSPGTITPDQALSAEDMAQTLSLPMERPGWQVVLVYTERHPDDFCFQFELDELCEHAPHIRGSLKVAYSVTGDPAATPEWTGHRGRATPEMLSELCGGDKSLAKYRCYLCGPGRFAETLRNGLTERGVPDQFIMAESFE
eukprot:TRINITY_DN64921_c0_g1_i1.p1 TRINITY_DN64921_c0_g1~~TRINITY_DN64921_c0_g1_i1.p1  ORF type:complete len:491 (+),score=79.70 TRINITY_DN64921_c0_g1_i1:104-1576(+)